MRFTPLSIALALSLGFALPAAAAEASGNASSAAVAAKASKYTSVEGITEYRLANGLRVLLAPDASKPTTTVNITYLVGSRHESYGETGMAHLLEHMVFKGTPSRGNIMQELGKRGMQFNGTTFMDRTNYFETFPSSDESLEWALNMEADRMVNSFIAKADLDKEFSVVRNEMEMGENNPHRVLWKQLTAVTYDWHNYGHNTIGARSDVENVKIENLQRFYREYYQPDNAVLTITGKFDPAKTLTLVEQSFGRLSKPARTLASTYTEEAPRDGAREFTVSRVADSQLAAALYPTAAGAHPDSVAITALGSILADTPNGRLHKLLVEGKKAVGVEPWALDLAEPGYIIFWAELSKDQSLPQVRKLLLESVEGFKKKPVTEAELKRAKASYLNDIDKTINDPQKLAVELSESIAKGDWRLFFLNRDRMEALTVADVQRVAENYFKESNRTFGQFVPTKAPDRTVMPTTPDIAKLVENYQGKAAVAEGEAFDVSPANIEKRTQRLTLGNGLKVALTPKKSRANAVSGSIRLDFGDEKSLFGQSANADLAADMLLRGAGKMSRADITAQLDGLKSKLSVHGGGQTLSVNFETSRKHLPELLALVRDVLRAPTFPAAEFAQLKDENVAGIEANRSQPEAVAAQALARQFNRYPKGDIRYAATFDESIAEYKNAKLADVKRFYASLYGADHGEVALVGDFDAAEATAQIKSLFGDWKSKGKYARLSNPAPEPKSAVQQLETPDKANAYYSAELPLKLQDTSPDYAPLLVANKVLGGGVKSRLMDRLRQKDGISYGAGSGLEASSFEPSGKIGLGAIYAPQNLAKMQAGVQEELARLVRDGITAEELSEAKQSLMQQRQTSRAQDGALASLHVSQLQTGRTLAFSAEIDARIQALTLDEVNAVIKKYIDPSKILHVYAGDFAGAAKKAAETPAK
ncbi:M16 family metallopeptidase [Chitinimonas naiadis]